jgi:uncharacterized protein (TIGR03086 family)
MTTNRPANQTTTATTTTTAPPELTPDDPRLAFAKAIALGGTVVAGVRADQMDLPTPCEHMNVHQLLGHLVAALQRHAAVGRGDDDPFGWSDNPIVDVPGDRWTTEWTEAAHEIQAAWTDPALLGTMITVPWATLPGAVLIGIYTSEVTVHSWDLAKATGQHPAWDDEVVGGALAVMRAGLPAESRGGEIPFAAVVPVPADAPLIDQLVAWNGRDPHM